MWSSIKTIEKDEKCLATYRPCPVCLSEKSRNILEVNKFQFYLDSTELDKQFTLRQNICLCCHALYLNPGFSNLGFKRLFAEAGQSYGSKPENISKQISWLKDNNFLIKNSSLLDVGCYDGDFLSMLPKDIKKYGVDVDEPAIIRARKKYSNNEIEFFNCSFEDFNSITHQFDTIVMFHVLEHLINPVNVLIKLKDISKNNTKLVIEVPILEKGSTNDINGFFGMQHQTHFSINSLKACLQKAGWKTINETLIDDYNGFRIVSIPEKNLLTDFKNEDLKNDMVLCYNYLSYWYNSLAQIEKKISNLKNTPNFIIWGAGAHTEFLYQLTSFFHRFKNSKFLILDSDVLKHGGLFRNIKIYNTEILQDNNIKIDRLGKNPADNLKLRQSRRYKKNGN